MVREDLIGAIKNAIERGYSIESAKTSLINAGYKKEEIEEATRFIQDIQEKQANKPPIFRK